MTSPLTYIYLIAFVANVVAATLLVALAPAQPAKRSIVATVALAALWALSDFLSNVADHPGQIRVISMVFVVAWSLVPYFVLRVALAYSGHRAVLGSRAFSGVLSLPAVFCCVLVFGGWLHEEYVPSSVNGVFFVCETTLWQQAVNLYFVVYTAVAALLLWRARRRTALTAYGATARLMVAGPPAVIVGGLFAGSLSPLDVQLPFAGSIVLGIVAFYAAVGMLRHEVFAPIDVFRSERDQAREILTRREEVLEGIPAGVAIIEPQCARVMFSNERFRRLAQIEEGGGLPPALVAAIESRPAGADFQMEVDETGERLLSFRKTAITYSGETAFLITLVDVTRQRQLERQLQEAQKMEAIGTLAGGVAHDINNLLCSIMGFASLIQLEQAGEGPWVEDIGHILEATRRGRSLTRNLLGFARRGGFLEKPVDVDATVAEIVALLRRTTSRTIAVTIESEAGLPKVHGDPTQIHQALMNVCLNAVDAVDEHGAITIRTETIELPQEDAGDLEPGQYVKVSIEDDGVGMDRSTLERCLEPLFTTKPLGQGTGLGLSMVYGTVTRLGGRLEIDSSLGEGTVVTFLLPGRSEEVVAASSVPAPDARRPGHGTVLLVDDEKTIRAVGKRMLERLGYSVLVAENGFEALSVYQVGGASIDLVILDLVMPVMNGEETFHAMRAIDSAVKVLIISGHSRHGLVGELLEAGASGFLQKPFDIDQLSSAMTRALYQAPEGRVPDP